MRCRRSKGGLLLVRWTSVGQVFGGTNADGEIVVDLAIEPIQEADGTDRFHHERLFQERLNAVNRLLR